MPNLGLHKPTTPSMPCLHPQVDRQRREADYQRELGSAAKKLRSQKALSDQLQRTLQQERTRSVGDAGGSASSAPNFDSRPWRPQAPNFPPGANGMFRAQPFF